MAKKRKSRTSEPQQQPDPPQPEPEPEPELELEPEPVQEPEPNLEEEEQVIEEEEEEEEEEEVEEEEEEPVDYEDNKDENDAVPDGEEKQTLENASNDVVVSANGEEKKEEEDEEEEPIENLLEPFTKEQLVTLLKEAVDKHPDFTENVKKLADADPVHRKIFVHGLGWDTNTESLTDVFGKYGEIEDCKAVIDKATGKSKGYGFILFKHRSGAKKALKEPQKKIGNRMTSCQLASAGPGSGMGSGPAPAAQPAVSTPASEYTQRKIFVSNVGPEIDTGKLLEFFSKFGEIEEGPLGLDKQTGKPKGFCLFVYKTIESARKALEEPHKNFEGHMLHCQKAVDGPKGNKGSGGGGGGGGYYQQQQQHHHHHGQHHHSQQPYYGHAAKKGKYSGSSGASGAATSGGHLMAPAAGPAGVGFNPAVPPAALTPALGQALALLATQGAGLGFGNLLGGIGAPGNQGMGVAPTGYGGQGGAYGIQPGLQGAYPNPQMGQGGARPSQGGAPYMGHGH